MIIQGQPDVWRLVKRVGAANPIDRRCAMNDYRSRRWCVFLFLLLSVGACQGLLPGWLAAARAEEPAPAEVPDASGEQTPLSAEEQKEYYELLKLFVDTLDQVDRNYAKKVSRRELMEAAIEGLLSKLDDYSNFISPEELDDFQRDVFSEFGGIGIQIGIENGGLTVISPLVGTPAYRAGLVAGDRILRINGERTRDMTVSQAVQRLQGPPETEVSLTVVHRGSSDPQTVAIRREIIRIETVLGDRRTADDAWQFLYDDKDKIGYVRITTFSERTAADLRRALRELKEHGMRGLVLDLRLNPGGLLTSAVAVSDLFLAGGVIVTTEGRNVPKQAWEAKGPGTFDGFPMAVLVNQYSASASEIVAAALQDHKRAVIVGQRTYGKGSVQQLVDLESGRSALKLTTGGYHRPSGKNIDRAGAPESEDWGVRPDPGFEVELSDEEFQEWFFDRRDRDIIPPRETVTRPEASHAAQNAGAPDQADGNGAKAKAKVKVKFVDRQLERALEYLEQQVAQSGGQSK
jgi:carboxyl-terminal processing protease